MFIIPITAQKKCADPGKIIYNSIFSQHTGTYSTTHEISNGFNRPDNNGGLWFGEHRLVSVSNRRDWLNNLRFLFSYR